MPPEPTPLPVEKLKGALANEAAKQFELAAKHYYDLFAYHAAQRLTAFNFFIVSLSFLSTAYATLVMKGVDGQSRFAMAAGLALAAYVLVLAFARLDRRNEQIISANERPLLRIQQAFADAFAEAGEAGVWQTFRATDNAFLFRTFGDLLPVIYLVAATLTAAGASYAFKEAGAITSDRAECISAWMTAALVALAVIAIYGKGLARNRRTNP